MEICILIGLYGSGKSTILKNISSIELEKISLDELDIKTRTIEKRIHIIYQLFQKFQKINIQYDIFKKDYLYNFTLQNKSLINTLSILYSKYSLNPINEKMKNQIRKEILIPSILNYFLLYLENIKLNKNVIIDSGAMHFLSMDSIFFEKLAKIFEKINLIYLNNTIENSIHNLLQKNCEHYSFLERGFKKEIYEKIENIFGIKIPKNLTEATEFIEGKKDIENYIIQYINNILCSSKKDLEMFIENINKENILINIYKININLLESIENIINRIKNLIKINIKMDKSEIQLIRKKPKAIFFDLSSTILDSHKIDLECIDAILTKYGLPKWSDGTNKKKDKNKSMKDNFINFFGEQYFNEAYKEYFQLLLDNINRMPLINGIEDTLKYCKVNNIKCVIVSNRDKIFVDQFFKIFCFKDYFDEIITPETSGYTKPNPKIVQPYIDKLNIDKKNESILFMGDAFADIRCGYKSGCIPILFTEIIRDEISPQNLERLSKINPDNPIIIIKKQSEFIELLEKSKLYWNNREIIKITYIGANGKIGKQAVNMICSNIPKDKNIEIVLIGSGTQDSLTRLDGFVKDLIGGLELKGENSNIKFTITNNYKESINSKIVICSAGKWPTKKEKEEFNKIDPSGRLVQSKINAKLISEITSNLNKYCPKTLFLIVTNQVDMMCHIARTIAKDMNIIGLSGGVDSSRLKQKIKDIYGLNSNGYMIGFHNESMIPIIKSIKTIDGKNIFPLISEEIIFSEDKDLQEEFKEMEKEKLDHIILSTREIGGLISKEQMTGLNTNIDTGASILPATAICRLVNSYCFNIPHIESYNTVISNPKIATHYGIKPNTELSIPLRISKDKVEQLDEIPLLNFEKLAMNEAQNKLNDDLKIIY